MENDDTSIPWCGMEILKKYLNPSFGRGSGSPGFKRMRYARQKPVEVYERLKNKGNNRYFHWLTRMYLEEFDFLLADLSFLRKNSEILSIGVNLTFENKILLFFI